MRSQLELLVDLLNEVEKLSDLDKGEKLFEEVFNVQKKRIYNALLNSSSKEVINFNNVLNKIINEKI